MKITEHLENTVKTNSQKVNLEVTSIFQLQIKISNLLASKVSLYQELQKKYLLTIAPMNKNYCVEDKIETKNIFFSNRSNWSMLLFGYCLTDFGRLQGLKVLTLKNPLSK